MMLFMFFIRDRNFLSLQSYRFPKTMEHMTLETAQLSMKTGSKGVPVISKKLQTIKKKPKL